MKLTPDQRKAAKRAQKRQRKTLASAANESNEIERRLEQMQRKGVTNAFLRIRPRIDD